MPVSANKSSAPPAVAGADGLGGELKWTRWVAGRKSAWQGRGVGVLGGGRLVMSGCTSSKVDALPDQTFVYNIKNNSWQSYEVEGTGPIAAPQHVTATFGNTLFVFWHLHPRRAWLTPATHTGQLICSIMQTAPTMQWSLGEFSGTPPNLTTGFTATPDTRSSIIIYGGQDDLSQVSGALHVLELSQGRYTQLSATNTPPPRTHHTATCIPPDTLRDGNNEGMLIWGGMTSEGRLLNDMHFLDFTNWSWTEVSQQGLMPTARMGHSMVVLDGHLVLYGGESSIEDTTSSVTSCFNLAHCRWVTDISESGTIPPVRTAAFAAPCLDGNHMLLFGGKQPLTDEPYFDLFGLQCDLKAGPGAANPDDDDFLAMAPQVQLLSLEQERARLQEDNLKLRSMADPTQRSSIQMAVEGERSRWEQEQQERGEAETRRAEDMRKAEREREEAHRELLQKHLEMELKYNELQMKQQEDHEAELEKLKQHEHDMQQRLDDEWNKRMEEHEEEFRREKEALVEQAEMLSNEQQRLKMMWEEQKRDAEEQRVQFDHEKHEIEEWEREEKAKLQQEREALHTLKMDLEKRERDIEDMIRHSKEEIALERRELAKLRRELEGVEKMRNNLIVEQAEVAEEKKELERLREENEKHHSEHDDELEMSAVQTSIVNDGGIPPGCSRFLLTVYDTAKRWTGRVFMTLPNLFRLLKCGQLMRGHVTVDLVLDVIHAAQGSVHPSDPTMPTELDCDVFITIVVDVIHRLYGSTANETVDMTVVEHIIEGGLRRSWGDVVLRKLFSKDDVILDEICSLPVAEVLHEYKDILMKLFRLHANCHSETVSPYEFMTLLQLVSCLEAMRVIPHLTSVDDVCNEVACMVTEAVDELSPHELTEVIARIALLGFSDDAPACDKVHRLISSEELREAATNPPQESGLMSPTLPSQPTLPAQQHTQPAQPVPAQTRQAPERERERERRDSTNSRERRPSSSRTRSPSASQKLVMSQSAARDLLTNKVLLKEEMKRVYLYYSSLNTNSEGVNAQKWSRLCQDCGCIATHRHYAQSTPSKSFIPSGLLTKTAADQLFVESLAECGVGKNGCLDFDGLMVAFRRLGCKLYPLDTSPNDALHKLLLEHVLPHALRCAETLLEVDLDLDLEDMLHRNKGVTVLYHSYCTGASNKSCLTAQVFMKLMTDFKIVPSLLSNTECGQVYRAAKLQSAQAPLAVFYMCLLTASHVAFGKHPYNTKLVGKVVRLRELLDRMSVDDMHDLKHILERLGVKVKGVRTSTPTRGTPPKKGVQQSIALDDEQGLDKALKGIFASYSNFGRMEVQNFVKLCIDAKVAHRTDFPKAQIESTFRDACGVEEYLTFDEWCDALLLLGHRRFPSVHQSDALRALLTTCIFPLLGERFPREH